jgi:hypothetical protein
MRVSRVLLCAALLFTQSLFSDGFVAGTPIKTAAGLVSIESLKVGDVVASFDQTNNFLSESTVTATTCILVPAVFEVKLADKNFEFLPNTFLQSSIKTNSLDSNELDTSLFTQLSNDDFKQINQLIENTCVEMFRLQRLNGNNKLENLFSIRLKKGPFAIHLIEVDPDHTFFATEQEILFHNWIASFGFTFAWGAGRALTFTNPFVFIGVTLASIAIDQAIRNSQRHGNTTEEKIFNYMDKLAESTATNTPMQNPKEPNNKKPDDPKKKIKSLEDILEESKFCDKTNKGTKIYEKDGGFDQANKDFDNLDLSEIKDIPKGRIGKLANGRRVNVRNSSSDKRPTLEIQRLGGKKAEVKIRFN